MHKTIPLALYFSAALMLMGCPKKVKAVEGETVIEVEEVIEAEELPEADEPSVPEPESKGESEEADPE